MTIMADWKKDGVEYRLSGRITADEVREDVFAYSSDPRADAARYKLVDLRGVEEVGVSEQDLKIFGAFEYGQSLSTPDLRMAFIVPDGRFGAQIEAFTHLLKDGTWQVRTFTDADAARTWAETGREIAPVRLARTG